MPQRKTRVIASGLVIGLAGYLSMIAFIMSDCGSSFNRCISSGGEVILPAIIGAALAGMIFYALFGGAGRKGWLLAALGSVLVTSVGAMLAVLVLGFWSGESVLNDLTVVLIGPWFIMVMFDKTPLMILVWIGIMAAAHLVLRRYYQNDTKL